MSVKAMTWVFDHSPYTLGARCVHLALADAANDAHHSLLWDPQRRTAEKAKVSRATVNSTMTQMVADGYLEEVTGPEAEAVRALMRDKRAKVYRFLMPADVSDSRQVEDATCQVETSEPVKLSDSLLLLTQEELNAHELLGFDKFWEVYPARKNQKLGRRASEKQWKKLGVGDRRAAYRGARNLRIACDKDPDRFPKDPERFLLHRDWEDWQEAEAAAITPLRRKPWEEMTDDEFGEATRGLPDPEYLQAEAIRRQHRPRPAPPPA